MTRDPYFIVCRIDCEILMKKSQEILKHDRDLRPSEINKLRNIIVKTSEQIDGYRKMMNEKIDKELRDKYPEDGSNGFIYKQRKKTDTSGIVWC